jgi:chromate transporter
MTTPSPAPDSSSARDRTASAPQTPPEPAPPPPSLSELFIAFATIALAGFGGVLAWSRRMMVEERRWLTAEQFNEAYALCAFLPGGNILNFAVIFGARARGALGAVASLAGLLAPPMVLIVMVGALYAYYGNLPALSRALTGVAAAAAGLMVSTVAKMIKPLFRKGAVFGALIAVATFVSIGIVHWPLPLVLLVILPISIGQSWIWR